MATQEREVHFQTKEIFLPDLLAKRFVDQLADKGFALYKLDFAVKSEYHDHDGTLHTTTRPVVAHRVSDLMSGPRKYLLENEGVLGYFIEFETIEHEDGMDYFVGITQVPPIKAYENLNEWTEIVMTTRIEHPRKRGGNPPSFAIPSLAIVSSGWNSIRVEYAGEDIILEKFFEDLQK